MASKSLKWICKVIAFSSILMLLRTLAIWLMLWNTALHPHFKTRENNEIVGDAWMPVLAGYSTSKSERTLKSREENGKIVISKRHSNNSQEAVESIYGSDCPFNPHKKTLNSLFNHWMALDNYYNLSSFLCGGSLIGSLRNGDLIPYDRDTDVCLTLENYQKVRAIRSRKPFNHHSNQVFLAVQEDFSNNDVWNRTRVNCKGRIVRRAMDPCSFETPGARLISRGVYVDVFVFREHGMFFRDHEYEKDFLKTSILPTKSCMFMDTKTKCPRDEMALLLKYYEPDVLTKPHYLCKNKTWIATSVDAQKKFKIWFDKRLARRSSKE